MTVVDQSDLSTPRFCISVRPDCSGNGIGFDTLDIAEVNIDGKYVEGGQYIKLMWSLQPISKNAEIREFTYGIVPNGWRETIRQKQLDRNIYYTVNGNVFIRVGARKGEKKIEVLDYARFRSRYQ